MYFAVLLTYKPEAMPKRSELYDAFGAYLRDHPDHPDVIFRLGGPTLADNGQDVTGLHLVIEAASVESARSFVADSPYGKADLFAESRVCHWDWRTGRQS